MTRALVFFETLENLHNHKLLGAQLRHVLNSYVGAIRAGATLTLLLAYSLVVLRQSEESDTLTAAPSQTQTPLQRF